MFKVNSRGSRSGVCIINFDPIVYRDTFEKLECFGCDT